MKIEELTPGFPITIVAHIGAEQLMFSSRIEEVYPSKHIVLASVVYHSGKAITFRAEGIVIDILLPTENDKPQIFNNVSLNLVRRKDGSVCYGITTPAESRPFNRRKHYRCFVGLDSAVRHGTNQRAHRILLRDVSEGGFSFVCNSNIPFESNQIVHTVLNDSLDDASKKVNFNLYGIIVRSYELDDSRTVYGCRLNKQVPGLGTYIYKKERLRLKNNVGKLVR